MSSLLLIALICSIAAAFDAGRTSAENFDRSVCYYSRDVPMESVDRCIDHVKLLAADTGRFWFGERWKSQCPTAVRSHLDALGCYNPTKLQRYESLGARLLRVSTFDMAYLRNLVIFPEMIFVSEPGEYVGCDHHFRSERRREIFAEPFMARVSSWHVRRPPNIQWANMAEESHMLYIVLIIDVGFNDLHYLAYNYPTRTVVVNEYSNPIGFRDVSNPIAVLVFKQETFLKSIDWRSALDEDATFNVQRFMLYNNLSQSWIGLNWMNLGTDAYSIEEQRQKSVVDNCPMLIRNRLHSLTEGLRWKWLPQTAITSIDTWMTVTYLSKPISFTVCCKKYSFEAAEIRCDPLGDKELRSVYVREPPKINVLRMAPSESELYNYRRFSRDYLTSPDDGPYTLLMVDTEPNEADVGFGKLPLAHWLVINLRGNHLLDFQDSKAGMTVLPYMPPTVSDDRPRRYAFLLFRQQAPIKHYDPPHYSPRTCKPKYFDRCSFNVEELMARNELTLRSVSWFTARQDEFTKYQLVNSNDVSEKEVCQGAFVERCWPVIVNVNAAGERSTASVGRIADHCPSFLRLLALSWLLFSLIR